MQDNGLSFHRKADVVFREGLGCCSRTGHVVQFGELAAVVEGLLIREAVEHGSHPPREPLHFPDAAQADLRISIEQVATSRVIKMLERPSAELVARTPDPHAWSDTRCGCVCSVLR